MFFGTRNSLVYVKIWQNYQKHVFWPFFWPKMAKNPDILAKKQNFRFWHDRGLYICFGTRNSLVYAKIRKNDQKSLFWPFFWSKMAKNPDILAKKQHFQFWHDRDLFICFFGMRNSLVYAKIHINYQKSLFWPFFGQKWPKIPTF